MSQPLKGELNPEQGVTAEVREHWYKIAAVLVMKLKAITGEEVTVTTTDLERLISLFPGDEPAIVMAPKGDIMRLLLLPMREAKKKMQQ